MTADLHYLVLMLRPLRAAIHFLRCCCCCCQLQIVQLTTFGVNYVGHPFNSGLSENKGMLSSLRYSSCFLALLISEAVPPLNER